MYEDSYSELGFWEKIAKLPADAGCAVLKQAITLYVILTESEISVMTRAAIAAALGYFIFPFDLIPDFLPGGFVDDLAVMAALTAQLCILVTPEIAEKIRAYLPDACKDKD